ncbi:hypothetical protein GCM10010182_68240 [Actinomadura cremea]|nr:hypothetical protein GCM10010182_68240 [Actinomadura cremea]
MLTRSVGRRCARAPKNLASISSNGSIPPPPYQPAVIENLPLARPVPVPGPVVATHEDVPVGMCEKHGPRLRDAPAAAPARHGAPAAVAAALEAHHAAGAGHVAVRLPTEDDADRFPGLRALVAELGL